MDEPRLLPAIVLALLGVLCVVPAWQNPGMVGWLRAALVLAGGVLFAFAFLVTLEWVLCHVGGWFSQRMLEAARARAITPEGEVLRLLGTLQPHQVEAWLRRSTSMVATPGVAGPTLAYDVDGELIPAEFVQEFLEASDEEGLAAIRGYAEGTSGRAWATAITGFYVKRGLARSAVGNQAARWTYGREEALGWFLME